MQEPQPSLFNSIRQGNAASQHENNAVEASPICQAWWATLRSGQGLWEKRFDQTPQRIRNKHGSHVKIPQEQ
jgi:hypothetical protein